ncbi:dihydrodipicolinate synthase [Alkaliphilus metalliredigens QYMF]|uniref:4-hydroxy-tetrahydrodipicolinate synthase n=1 Tax=Alkaliphilus metalliredigens (strain QYMF) TaxID=293826 RepID=A6TJU6_ALKMQ|nr:4-hydroxy-tetrahydrodipicolinate synthase [Alkaliphilus metalliredigens]ABR46464.1 dihydrodipicolinate synthase [Alkaliphilus metalliredigens QYMF]
MVNIHGIVPAMVTPMNEDETINEKELRAQVNRQIEAGVHGLFCLGTNGEFYILNQEEKLKVMEIVIHENAGRLPVFVGTGAIGTKETVQLSQKAQELGADVLSVITPYFAAASQNEIYEHFKTVANSVDIPILPYNIPMRTGANINVDTLKRLSQIPNITGVKDSSGNFDNILQYIESTDDSFAVLSGNDSLVLWTLQAGGKGAICGIANLFPHTMASIYELWKAGEFAEAKKVQDSIREIRNCFKLGNPNTIVKIATNLLGHPVGPCRKPFYTNSESIREEIQRVLHTYYKDFK